MNVTEEVRLVGDVDYVIDWKDGRQETGSFKNTVLRQGRQSLAKALANQLGGGFQFYVTHMLFGDGGTQGGVKKYVDAGRNGLFGTTRLSKPVIAMIDPTISTQAIFTSVIAFDEAVSVTLNEMALQMADGNLYSLTTFADLNKTSDMQITWNWRLLFI